jgi:hypothetical protein
MDFAPDVRELFDIVNILFGCAALDRRFRPKPSQGSLGSGRGAAPRHQARASLKLPNLPDLSLLQEVYSRAPSLGPIEARLRRRGNHAAHGRFRALISGLIEA